MSSLTPINWLSPYLNLKKAFDKDFLACFLNFFIKSPAKPGFVYA
nr:MAG TPA: hypothetical protein [Bacteriophage sp.]